VEDEYQSDRKPKRIAAPIQDYERFRDAWGWESRLLRLMEKGRVDLPGGGLRVADNSSVKMISPDLANTEVAVEKGRAAVEVLDIHKENNIRLSLDDTSAKLLNKGLYDFDANQNRFVYSRAKRMCLRETWRLR
jgi:enolase